MTTDDPALSYPEATTAGGIILKTPVRFGILGVKDRGSI